MDWSHDAGSGSFLTLVVGGEGVGRVLSCGRASGNKDARLRELRVHGSPQQPKHHARTDDSPAATCMATRSDTRQSVRLQQGSSLFSSVYVGTVMADKGLPKELNEFVRGQGSNSTKTASDNRPTGQGVHGRAFQFIFNEGCTRPATCDQ